jgi:hypothetical protein
MMKRVVLALMVILLMGGAQPLRPAPRNGILEGIGSGSTYCVTWGDYDADTDVDLAVGDWGDNCLYTNNGDGTFTEQLQFGSRNTNVMAWGDYDNDSDLDLAVGNHFGENYLYINNGDGTFTEQQQFGSGDTWSMAWGDYDNDSDLDLAVGMWGSNYLYTNNGNGTFTEQQQFGSGETFELSWGDYDNDSDLDMAVGNYYASNMLYENNGDGTFTGREEFGTRYTRSLAWADCDKDGDLDLAAGNTTENVLYVNNGNKTFTEQISFGMGDTWCVRWGDWNNDTYPDLAVGNDGESSIYVNCQDGTFLSLVMGDGHTYSVDWGDYDNDSDSDIAVGRYNEENYIFENGITTFGLIAEKFDRNTFFVAGNDAYCTDVLGSAKIAFGLGRGGAPENPEGRTDSILTAAEHDAGNLIIMGGPAINPLAVEFDPAFDITYVYIETVSFEILCEGQSIYLDLNNYPGEDVGIVYIGQHGPRTVMLVWGYGWEGTYAGSAFIGDLSNWTGHHLVMVRWLDGNGDFLVQEGEIIAEVLI